MLIDTIFKETEPERRIDEIRRLMRERGMNPDTFLVRLFDLQRAQLVREHGTDRMGVGRRSTDGRVYKYNEGNTGIDEEVFKRGLGLEDGLYLASLDPHSPSYKAGVTQAVFRSFGKSDDCGGGSNGKYGTAMYHADAMEYLGGDFYIFKDPSRKRNALVGIIVPTESG